MKRKIILIMVILIGKTAMATAQNTNVFRYPIGDGELILLSEGQGTGNASILIPPFEKTLNTYAPDGTYPNAVDAFLWKSPDRTVLFDTGFGRLLFDNLESIGVSTEDIREIMLTHLHGDHIGGLVNNDRPAFPNATLLIGKEEFDYWTNESEMNRLPESKRGNFIQAQKITDIYPYRLLEAEPVTSDFSEGIYPVQAFGHTPGHLGFMIVFKGQKLLVWGDLTHAMAVQMPDPSIAVTYDVDPKQAVTTRLQILDYVSQHGIPVAGMHIPYPGIGTVTESPQAGFKFLPAQ